MFLAGLELTILDSGGQCADHCATKALQLEREFVLFIDNRFERGQNCVNAIGIPCLSANIVKTQGVPIGVKAQLSERVSSLTRR